MYMYYSEVGCILRQLSRGIVNYDMTSIFIRLETRDVMTVVDMKEYILSNISSAT